MRALVAYSSSSTFVQTTVDYLMSFKKYSGFEADYVHVTHDARIGFDFDSYDFVFHNYCARLCFEGYVSESYREKLRRFRGVKILAVQDEYDRTNTLKAAITDLGFNVVLTCVPQESLEYVYPRAEFPDVTFITVFTGYVSDDFATNHPAPMPLAERPIMVGYRGRDIGGKYGRLGFDKFEIGRRMKDICAARGIPHDIAMDEASRIYGMAWFEFLGSCRSMLGTESGSNVFDFDGAIERRLKEMTEANGGVQPSYEQFLPVVAQRDSEISMGQISPRVFECALMRTPMVLFRGHYSGAIAPDEHYIALEKDFSNVDDVLARLEDLPALEALTNRAYDHLVGSGRFSYRWFFGMVGDEARRRITAPVEGRPSVEAVSGGSFLLQGQTATEFPSVAPDSLDSFMVRANLSQFESLVAEVGRLEAEFIRHAGVCTGEIARLEGAISQQAARIAALFGERHASEIPPPLAQTGQLPAFLAEASKEDADWQAQSAEGIRTLAESEGRIVPASGYPALRAGFQGLVDRYRQIGERFEAFNRMYADEYRALESHVHETAKVGLRLAFADIRGGHSLRRNVGFVLRQLLSSGKRRLGSSANLARHTVKSAARWGAYKAPRVMRRIRNLVRRDAIS